MNQELINRGGAALDAVKHCQDKMTAPMAAHDKNMRETPPNEWTERMVVVAECIERIVNKQSALKGWQPSAKFDLSDSFKGPKLKPLDPPVQCSLETSGVRCKCSAVQYLFHSPYCNGCSVILTDLHAKFCKP